MSGALRRGQFAYAAYGACTGGKTFDGRDMPTWDDLGDRIQQAWIAAGNAAAASGPDTVTSWLCKHCGLGFPTREARIEHKLDLTLAMEGTIMSDQTKIDTDVAAINASVADENTAVQNIQAEIAALKTANPGLDFSGLDTAVAGLQTAQSGVDALETPAVDGDGTVTPAE